MLNIIFFSICIDVFTFSQVMRVSYGSLTRSDVSCQCRIEQGHAYGYINDVMYAKHNVPGRVQSKWLSFKKYYMDE